MNAKETERACNINVVGCATLRNILLHDAAALPTQGGAHGGQAAGTRPGHIAASLF